MILLLGASGYIGQAFAAELRRRDREFCPVSRADLDYTRFEALTRYLEVTRPSLLINAAGFTGRPNVDACETARAETLLGNTILPQTIAHACAVTGTPWAHVSSGCIYTGAKVVSGGSTRVEPDLTTPEMVRLRQEQPGAIAGFTEEDEPNFSFRRPPCSFYSGSKALAEEVLQPFLEPARSGPALYVWRLRIPFDEVDNGRNYLSKLQRYSRVYDNVNSISHRRDFAQACLDLFEKQAPSGIYNVTNTGWTTARSDMGMIERILKPARSFEFWKDDAEFYRVAAQTPRSNCVMDNSRLRAAGASIRPVEEALEESLRHWRRE
jgi:dTDP-4-dehydrorhamnose reductase